MPERLQILLIEDDPDDVELLETAFKDNAVSAEFIVISQGDRVLPYLISSANMPDIMLLDLNLPKIHGKDVLSQIKAVEHFCTFPVIILTTSSAQSDIDFCKAAGADYYFTKPTRLKDFATIVQTIIAATCK